MPGFGYSTVHPNRIAKDWHKDANFVLEKEKVDKFVVMGVSLGADHALEMAYHYGKERVLGIILEVPNLSPEHFDEAI